ncbi:MAG: hypothetical protein IJY10_02070 [Lachnospiraceae bacterium]|nr:hypothetical protein [Lachnospiraceae bacterium]
MRKHTKIIIFVVTVLFNAAFLFLCGYGQDLQPHTASYIDAFFGVVTVVLLGLGETSVIQQLYLKDKFRDGERRLFDHKLWRQCFFLVLYYVIAILFVASIIYTYSVFYVAVLALVLCPFWISGSRTLWTGQASYYLNDLGILYKVSNVMENEEVVEMLCQREGDRERTITIAKKKQKLDQYSE